MNFDNGSFRDRNGRVVLQGKQVFRTLGETALKNYRLYESSGCKTHLEERCGVIESNLFEGSSNPDVGRMSPTGYFLQHPFVDFVSYPYEWPFQLLKKAALLHLEVHLGALKYNFNMVDGSAYNVQFAGSVPIFIDTLSFVPYADGDYWLGYRQFCEQFLIPLLMTSKQNFDYHSLYKGSLSGIDVRLGRKLLGSRSYSSVGAFLHVFLQDLMVSRSLVQGERAVASVNFTKLKLTSLLEGLHRFISGLSFPEERFDVWKTYASKNSYDPQSSARKKEFISKSVSTLVAPVVCDFGCNSGVYSEAALSAGAVKVIGTDIDHSALHAAVRNADAKNLQFTPIFTDLTNPSSGIGWNSSERKSLKDRLNCDFGLYLALIHHLVIGGGVLLDDVVNWMVMSTKYGIIEFVPKSDSMVKKMLSNRDDIFADYSEESFYKSLSSRAKIVAVDNVGNGDRKMFFYERL